MQEPSLNVTDNSSLPVMPTETRVVKRWVLQLLSFIFGQFGVDRFYSGDMVLGVIKLVTGGGFGVWTIVDIWIQMAEGAVGDTTTSFGWGKDVKIEASSILAGRIIGVIYWFLLSLAIVLLILFFIFMKEMMSLFKGDKAPKSKSPDAAASDNMDMNIIGRDNVVQ